MKIGEQNISLDQQEIVAPAPTERRLLTRQIRKPGLTLWAINMKTNECKPVEIKKSFIEKGETKKGEQDQIHHEVNYSPDFFYVEALNKKNAFRKYKRRYIALKQLNQRAKAQASQSAPAPSHK